MMAHSFFGYKPELVIHHINENKLDNRLCNLRYLSHEEHTRLHMTGKKYRLGKSSKKQFR